MLWTIGAWASLVITLLYGVGLIVFRKKIRICVALVKEASVVIKDRPLHVCFPFFTLSGTLLLLLFFIFGMLFISTAELTEDHFSGGPGLTSGATFAQTMAVFNATAGDDGIPNAFSESPPCFLGFCLTVQVRPPSRPARSLPLSACSPPPSLCSLPVPLSRSLHHPLACFLLTQNTVYVYFLFVDFIAIENFVSRRLCLSRVLRLCCCGTPHAPCGGRG